MQPAEAEGADQAAQADVAAKTAADQTLPDAAKEDTAGQPAPEEGAGRPDEGQKGDEEASAAPSKDAATRSRGRPPGQNGQRDGRKVRGKGRGRSSMPQGGRSGAGQAAKAPRRSFSRADREMAEQAAPLAVEVCVPSRAVPGPCSSFKSLQQCTTQWRYLCI